MWVRVVGAFLACVAAVSCADVEAPGIEDPKDAAFTADGKADAFGVSETSDLACSVLRLANDATLEELDGPVGLSSRAAEAVVAHRPFPSLEALDAAPYIGPAAFAAMAEYGAANYVCDALPRAKWRARLIDQRAMDDELPPATPMYYAVHLTAGRLTSGFLGAHGIGTNTTVITELFGPVHRVDWDQNPIAVGQKLRTSDSMLCDNLTCINGGLEIPETGVYALRVREVDGKQGFIRVWGGLATEQACTTDSECGPEAVCESKRLIGTADDLCAPAPVEATECWELGGTYRLVDFTAEEACHTLRFLNEASWLDLRPLPMMQWSIYPARDYSRRQWASLAQFTRMEFEYGSWTSRLVNDLKRTALAWNPDQHRHDTVADVWATRGEHTVVLADVIATKSFTMTTPDGAKLECVEVRDEPAASRYLAVCNDVTALCESCQTPIADFVGKRVITYGGMTYTGRRWLVITNGQIFERD